MRLFIAGFLSPANQTSIDDAVRALAEKTSPVLRAVPPRSAHLTFAFVPRAADGDVARLTEALRRAAESSAPIRIQLAGAELLRAGAAPRLLYLPVTTGLGDLERLGAAVGRAIHASAPDLEVSAATSPHVTLARFRKTSRPADADRVRRALPSSALSSLALDDVVAALQLVRSVTLPAGSEYTEIAAVQLERGRLS